MRLTDVFECGFDGSAVHRPEMLRWVKGQWRCYDCFAHDFGRDVLHEWNGAMTLADYLEAHPRRVLCASAICNERLCERCGECPNRCGFSDHERSPHEDCMAHAEE